MHLFMISYYELLYLTFSTRNQVNDLNAETNLEMLLVKLLSTG